MLKTKLLVIFLCLISLAFSWHLGNQHGKSVVQSEWDTANQMYLKAVEELKKGIEEKEDAHRAALEKYEADFNRQKGQYESKLSDIERVGAERLRQSEARSAMYKRKAEGTPSERDSLASHAAQLDRALEEGRSLEQEYRATLEQREREIKLLANQIIEDRKLNE